MTKDTNAKVVADIAEVFMFDQWLRHYFVSDKNGKLMVEIPQDDLKAIYESHAHLAPLADMMNNAELTYEKCQADVCAFVGACFDGAKYAPGVVARAMDSKLFKIEQYVFSVWFKMHEKYLDERRMTFAEWREMYDGWNSMEQVKEYRRKLMAGGGDPEHPATNAVN